MPQIGPAEILVILLVGLLVFGPKRLPEIGRQVGRGMRELRRFQDTVKGELDEVLHFGEDHDAKTSPAPSTTDALRHRGRGAPGPAPGEHRPGSARRSPVTRARRASGLPDRVRRPDPRPWPRSFDASGRRRARPTGACRSWTT